MMLEKKIETYINIGLDHFISELDIGIVYRIFLDLEKEQFDLKIQKEFHMEPKQDSNLKEWGNFVTTINSLACCSFCHQAVLCL